MRRFVAVIICAALLTGCAAAAQVHHTGPRVHRPSSPLPETALHRTVTTVLPEPGWTPISTLATGVAIDERATTTPDGARVTLVRLRAGALRFSLHAGSQDPPTHGVALGAGAQSQVAAQERPVLLGAFNGGFKVSGGAGGVEINGHVLTPLVAGLASLVIDADGSAHLGIWGETVPAPRESVVSVRQNLPPLVIDAQPSPSIAATRAWGDPLHGVAFTARSALGQDGSGDLIFAASMRALPLDMASALIGVGATTAMELDINPEWVQADVAASPGASLRPVVPGQSQPPDRYLLGWTRDFVTVDAPA